MNFQETFTAVSNEHDTAESDFAACMTPWS